MKIRNYQKPAALTLALAFLSVGITNAQTPNAYGYSTGYGTVYGSFGLASTMQSMYNVAQAQMQSTTARNAMIKKQKTRRNVDSDGSKNRSRKSSN